MHNLSSIRAEFLDFFVKNNHKLYPSSPLVPYNDSTLLFTNSGMVQFKNVFRGEEVLKDGANIISKATTSQKVIRAGGKHNDLENVGFTARHHTFFEMLGNFSFGDYFKEQAIKYAWEFLTKSLQLPKEKLFVTVFPEDEVSYKLWQKIAGLKEDRIIKLQGNFWSMGDLGPCGYNSEIFYDHGPSVFGGLPGTKDEDGDRFVEIWNLVFMEFDQVSKEKRVSYCHKRIFDQNIMGNRFSRPDPIPERESAPEREVSTDMVIINIPEPFPAPEPEPEPEIEITFGSE